MGAAGRRLFAVLISVALTLLALEGLLRRFAPGENVHTTATLGIFAPDPELAWIHKPSVRTWREWGGRTIVIRTDEHGYRVPDGVVPERADPQIAFAGDSYVFGNEVDAQETFVHLLGSSSGRPTANLGVNGYALSQECLALRRYLARRVPTAHAFLVIYIGNDIEYGAYPDRSTRVDADGFLTSEPATLGNDAQRLWTNARRFAVLHSRLMFELRTAWRRVHPLAPEAPPAAPSATPSPTDRWIYDPARLTRDRLSDHIKVLTALADDARSHGVALTVVLMPEREQVYGSLSDVPNRTLAPIIAGLGVPVIDLLPPLRSAAASGPPLWHDFVEGHLSPEGHRVVATVLMASLKDRQ